MLDQDMFEVMTKNLDMDLTEDTKRSLVQYLGRKYRNETIMFEYSEIERLTKIALTDSGTCFDYLDTSDAGIEDLT
jgi:hypothetical protein